MRSCFKLAVVRLEFGEKLPDLNSMKESEREPKSPLLPKPVSQKKFVNRSVIRQQQTNPRFFKGTNKFERKLVEFFNEASEVIPTGQALMRDIDLWEMKHQPSNQRAQSQFINENIRECNARLEKMRNLSINDIQFGNTVASGEINPAMIDTISHVGRKEEPKNQKRSQLGLRFETGFTEDDPTKIRFHKSQESLSKDYNKEIAKELLFRATQGEGHLVDSFGLTFLRNFKCLQNLKLESKVEKLLEQVRPERDPKMNPQRIFDFSKEFKLFKETSYNTQSLVKTLKSLIGQVSEKMEGKKEERRDLRIKHTRFCGELARINGSIEEEASEKFLLGGVPYFKKSSKMLTTIDHHIRNSKRMLTDHRISRIKKLKNFIEELTLTMDRLNKEISDLKIAKNDSMKVLKELYLFIMENEDEFTETSLKPVVKGFFEMNQEFPYEKLPKLIDQKAADFLVKISQMEMKVEFLLKQKGLKSEMGSPKNKQSKQNDKAKPADSYHSPVNAAFRSFDSKQNIGETLDLDERKTEANWVSKRTLIKRKLKESCGSLAGTHKIPLDALEAYEQRKNMFKINPKKLKEAKMKTLPSESSEIQGKRKKIQQNSDEVFKIYKEMREISDAEIKRLEEIFKREPNGQLKATRIAFAEFGKKEADLIIEDFKANLVVFERKKKANGFSNGNLLDKFS